MRIHALYYIIDEDLSMVLKFMLKKKFKLDKY
jgi:hypothetical protein